MYLNRHQGQKTYVVPVHTWAVENSGTHCYLSKQSSVSIVTGCFKFKCIYIARLSDSSINHLAV